MLMFQESRTEVLSQLAKKEAEKKALECELEKYKECDPDVMEQMKTELVIAKDAANRWTGRQGSDLLYSSCYNM